MVLLSNLYLYFIVIVSIQHALLPFRINDFDFDWFSRLPPSRYFLVAVFGAPPARVSRGPDAWYLDFDRSTTGRCCDQCVLAGPGRARVVPGELADTRDSVTKR